MRSLWTISALIAAVSLAAALEAQAQNVTMPCSTAGEFCGKLVSPDCLDKVGAGSTGLSGSTEACDANLNLYRECLETVAASCSGGADTAAAPAPEPATRAADGAAAQTLVMDSGDSVALRGCKGKGKLVTCEMTIKVSGDKSVQFCDNHFGLILENGDQLNATTVAIGGREGVICPSQKLYAVAPPARFQLKFTTAEALTGQAVQVIAFNAMLFDRVALE